MDSKYSSYICLYIPKLSILGFWKSFTRSVFNPVKVQCPRMHREHYVGYLTKECGAGSIMGEICSVFNRGDLGEVKRSRVVTRHNDKFLPNNSAHIFYLHWKIIEGAQRKISFFSQQLNFNLDFYSGGRDHGSDCEISIE